GAWLFGICCESWDRCSKEVGVAAFTVGSLFFCAGGQPLSSTLFPYTTLFRSVLWSPEQTSPAGRDAATGYSFDTATIGALLAMADRKSTRLNSSHVSISYAVFCLKKKRTESCPLPVTTTTGLDRVTSVRVRQS